MNLEHTCLACGAPDAPAWHEKDGYPIRRCLSCGTGFVEPSSLPLDLAKLYGPTYYAGDGRRTYLDYGAEREAFLRSADRVLSWLERFRATGQLLEVGCAMGFFLEAAQLRGWETMGFDVSKHAVAEANRRRPDLGVSCCDFARVQIEPDSCDAVVALDTIEHLARPDVLIEKAHRSLRTGGVCLISTGDFSSLSATFFAKRWRLLAPPEHVFFFTFAGLTRLFERKGFHVVGKRWFWRPYSIAVLGAALGITLPRQLARVVIPCNAFDVMHVVARKC